MTRTIRVDGVSIDDYHEEPILFLEEYGHTPEVTVSGIVESESVPDHTSQCLQRSRLTPNEAMLIADSLELATRQREFDSQWTRRKTTKIANWLREWANYGVAFETT